MDNFRNILLEHLKQMPLRRNLFLSIRWKDR